MNILCAERCYPPPHIRIILRIHSQKIVLTLIQMYGLTTNRGRSCTSNFHRVRSCHKKRTIFEGYHNKIFTMLRYSTNTEEKRKGKQFPPTKSFIQRGRKLGFSSGGSISSPPLQVIQLFQSTISRSNGRKDDRGEVSFVLLISFPFK
jgi:hypothetical protein